MFVLILLIVKIILEHVSVLGAHKLVDYGRLPDLPPSEEDHPEGLLLVMECVGVGGLPLHRLLLGVGVPVPPPEGVAPVDDLVVRGEELSGDLHVVDGETVGPAAALLG